MTVDIDVTAIHSVLLAIDDRLDPSLADALNQIGPFIARSGLHDQPIAWRDHERGVLVELCRQNYCSLGAITQFPCGFVTTHEPVQIKAFCPELSAERLE